MRHDLRKAITLHYSFNLWNHSINYMDLKLIWYNHFLIILLYLQGIPSSIHFRCGLTFAAHHLGQASSNIDL